MYKVVIKYSVKDDTMFIPSAIEAGKYCAQFIKAHGNSIEEAVEYFKDTGYKSFGPCTRTVDEVESWIEFTDHDDWKEYVINVEENA